MSPVSLRMAVAVLTAVLCCGCASWRDRPPPLPLLRLSPASVGQAIAVQQRMTVTVAGGVHHFQLALEADRDSIRVAVMDMGQTVAWLEWDGTRLEQTRAPGWPAAVSGERMLSELQLVHWPLPALQFALPPGWTVKQEGNSRVLRYGQLPVLVVRFAGRDRIELENLAEGYVVLIESKPWGLPP